MKDLCKYLTMGAWLLTLLVALDYGLGAIGRGGFLMGNSLVLQNYQLFQYLVLASALWSLYLFVMHLQGNKKGCSLC